MKRGKSFHGPPTAHPVSVGGGSVLELVLPPWFLGLPSSSSKGFRVGGGLGGGGDGVGGGGVGGLKQT